MVNRFVCDFFFQSEEWKGDFSMRIKKTLQLQGVNAKMVKKRLLSR